MYISAEEYIPVRQIADEVFPETDAPEPEAAPTCGRTLNEGQLDNLHFIIIKLPHLSALLEQFVVFSSIQIVVAK